MSTIEGKQSSERIAVFSSKIKYDKNLLVSNKVGLYLNLLKIFT